MINSNIFHLAVEEGAMYPLCDLTKTGIFEQQSDGAYDYSNDHIVKVTPKHPATGEELQNKAKILKEQGLLRHKMKQIYSGMLNDHYIHLLVC